MNINNPGNTGLVDGLIRSYTGGILGGTSVTAGSGTTGQGISDQVVSDGTAPPITGVQDPSVLAPSGIPTTNNPYQPADGDSWDATQAGSHKAQQGTVASQANGNQFQTGNWQQYLPQNLKSYVGNTIGNAIQNWMTPSTTPSTTYQNSPGADLQPNTITSGEDL